MRPPRLAEPRISGRGYRPDKRKQSLARIVESIAYVLLGVVLYLAWHHFKNFEGLPGALGALPHDHPMHRVIEAAVFLAVALVPLAAYLILRLGARVRRKKERR